MTSIENAAPDQVTWRDGKRYAWLLGLIIPTAPFLAWRLVSATGIGLFWWAGPIIVFGLIPLIDLLVGTDAENPPDSLIDWLENDRYYRWVTYLYLPIQYVSLAVACWLWTTHPMSIVGKIGMAITVGIVAGIGINTAHELGHKKDQLERWLSKIALAQSAYGHFFIDHNRSSITTAGTTSASRLRKTRPARGSARRSGVSCPARSPGA